MTMGNNLVELEIAARLLEDGYRAEAYGVAVHVLHRVGNVAGDESRLCWDRARAVAMAASSLGQGAAAG